MNTTQITISGTELEQRATTVLTWNATQLTLEAQRTPLDPDTIRYHLHMCRDAFSLLSFALPELQYHETIISRLETGRPEDER